jgi:hypothetical protein
MLPKKALSSYIISHTMERQKKKIPRLPKLQTLILGYHPNILSFPPKSKRKEQ